MCDDKKPIRQELIIKKSINKKRTWWGWGSVDVEAHEINVSRFIRNPHEVCKLMRHRGVTKLNILYRGECLCTVSLPNI